MQFNFLKNQELLNQGDYKMKKQILQMEKILTPEEVAIILRMNKQKVMDLIEYKFLKAVQTSKGVKIQRKSLDELTEKIFDSSYPKNFIDDRITTIFKPMN